MPASMVLAALCVVAAPVLAVALVALMVQYALRWGAYRRGETGEQGQGSR